jgi:hypothetical protein
MKGSFGVRALATAVAAGSLLVVPLAAAAPAATQPASCKAVVAKTVGSKVTITVSQCTPTTATGGGGSGTTTAGTGALKGKTINTIKWASNHGTTKTTVNFAPNPAGNGKCLKDGTRLKITGKVVSSTGLANNVIKANQPVTASVCVYQKGPNKGKTLIEPGTIFKM